MKYKYKISHILYLKDKPHEIKLDSIYSLLKIHPDKFSYYAEHYSDDTPTSKIGGDLGWFSFEDLPIEEFRDSVDPELKGKALKPINSKYGQHILLITDIADNNGMKDFKSEVTEITKYLKNKHENELDILDNNFKAFLFKLHRIEIDTIAIENFTFVYNYYKRKGLNQEEQLRDIWKEIVFAKYKDYLYSIKTAVQFLSSHPELKLITKTDVIRSIHSIFYGKLFTSAIENLNYIKNESFILKTKQMMIKEYIEQIIIRENFITKIVNMFEQGKLKEFPSKIKIYSLWLEELFYKYNLRISNIILDEEFDSK